MTLFTCSLFSILVHTSCCLNPYDPKYYRSNHSPILVQKSVVVQKILEINPIIHLLTIGK